MGSVKEIHQNGNGIDTRNFANSLSGLADQLRLIEQKITMNTDNEIQQTYRTQLKEINRTRSTIKKATKKQMQNTEKIVLSNLAFKARKRLS